MRKTTVDNLLKGISSIGGATVLHTEGQVFESPIPYAFKFFFIRFFFYIDNYVYLMGFPLKVCLI